MNFWYCLNRYKNLYRFELGQEFCTYQYCIFQENLNKKSFAKQREPSEPLNFIECIGLDCTSTIMIVLDSPNQTFTFDFTIYPSYFYFPPNQKTLTIILATVFSVVGFVLLVLASIYIIKLIKRVRIIEKKKAITKLIINDFG